MTTELHPATTVADGASVHWCVPGRPPELLEADRRPDGKGFVWVDLPHEYDEAEAARLLASLGIELAPDLVRDLLERDDLTSMDEIDPDVRHVSIVGVDVPQGWPRACAHELTEQMVETVAGTDFLITCWHRSRRTNGDRSVDRDGTPVLRGLRSRVLERLARGDLISAGDCATALVEETTRHHKHVRRALDDWLQEWELGFHSRRDLSDDSRTELRHLMALTNDVRRSLAALNNARAFASDGRWFPGVTLIELDREADNALDHTLARLQVLFDSLRADLDLVCMETMAFQAEETARKLAAEERFQAKVGKITALLLVPTLIAGIYGANTWVPGNGSRHGFVDMLVVMCAIAAAVYVFVVRSGPDR